MPCSTRCLQYTAPRQPLAPCSRAGVLSTTGRNRPTYGVIADNAPCGWLGVSPPLPPGGGEPSGAVLSILVRGVGPPGPLDKPPATPLSRVGAPPSLSRRHPPGVGHTSHTGVCNSRLHPSSGVGVPYRPLRRLRAQCRHWMSRSAVRPELTRTAGQAGPSRAAGSGSPVANTVPGTAGLAWLPRFAGGASRSRRHGPRRPGFPGSPGVHPGRYCETKPGPWQHHGALLHGPTGRSPAPTEVGFGTAGQAWLSWFAGGASRSRGHGSGRSPRGVSRSAVNPPERATPLRNISILSLLRDKTRAVAAPRRTAARGSTQHRLCRTGTIQHRAASVGRTLSRCLCRNAFVEMSQASGADGLPGSWPPLRAGSCSPPGRQALRSKHCRRPDPAVPQTAVQLPAGLVKHSDWATLSR